jgi:hypothetical protein
MTREEAQALAEELVLRFTRDSFRRRRMGWHDAATTYAGGIRAHYGVLTTGGDLMSNSHVMIAAIAIEVLRESFVKTGETAEEIREAHPLGRGEVPS